jgi:tetratricopeptide (TPR) repeat protein
MEEKTARPQEAGEGRFKDLMGVVLATVAVVAAALAFFQFDAGARSTTAYRDARRLTIESIGLRTQGQVQVGYGLYTAQVGFGLDMLARSAVDNYDPQSGETYQALRQQLVEMSPLLSTTYAADLARYEADVYLVQSTALAEQATALNRAGDEWDARSNSYIVHLALLAVVLALYGLSLGVSGSARWPLVGAGTALVVVVLAWAALVSLRPVPVLADEAIQAYARGVGLAHQGRTDEAVAAFDQALGKAPGYGSALVGRGNAHAARQEYQAAVDDYQAARQAGRDETMVDWNLGWNYYLLGQFDQAIAVDRRALEVDPTLLPVRFNLSLTLLAAGQVEAGRAEYQQAMQQAADAVAAARRSGDTLPYSFWFYLDTAAADLQGLLDRLQDRVQPWDEAPPTAAVAAPADVESLGPDLVGQLRGWGVALEYTAQPPSGTASAQVTPFAFGIPWGRGGGGGFALAEPRTPFESGASLEVTSKLFFPYGSPGYDVTTERYDELDSEVLLLADTFTHDTAEIWTYFDYQGMRNGQQVVWKVYLDGVEDTSLRRVEAWSLGQAGWALKPITFVFGQPGHYELDLFVDGHLLQRGDFTITEAANPEQPVVLFQDALTDPATGMLEVAGERYTLEYTGTGYRMLVSESSLDVQSGVDQHFDQVVIDVDVAKKGGADSGEFGLICALQASESWNGYGFIVSANGLYRIAKWVNGERFDLDGPRYAASLRRGNASNHLRAECSDGHMTLAINGQELAYAHDTDFSGGKIALLAGTSAGADIDVLFTNWVVTEPQ